jgi:hypothetical protein
MRGKRRDEGHRLSISGSPENRSFDLPSSSGKQVVGMDVFPRYRLVPHGDARRVNGLRVPGYEGMPPFQASPLRETDVGAGSGQPVCLPHALGGNPQTVGTSNPAMPVHGAPAGEDIQKGTRNRREVHLTGLFIPQFLKTADAATVTEGVPLFGTHLIQ